MNALTKLFSRLFLIAIASGFAQESGPYVEVSGYSEYQKTPESFLAKVVISQDLVYDGYESNFEQLRNQFFEALSKRGISSDRMVKDSLAYYIQSYRNPGMSYSFTTTSKDELIAFQSSMTRGTQSMGITGKFTASESVVDKARKEAIDHAKTKAADIAKAIGMRLGALISITDDSSSSTSEEGMYDMSTGKGYYGVKLKYALLP